MLIHVTKWSQLTFCAVAACLLMGGCGKQDSAKQVVGRWSVTIAEDWVFSSDGTLLVDSIGPLDFTGKYEVTAKDRIVIWFPNANESTEMGLEFLDSGETMRFVKLKGFLAGTDGRTLTRKR